MKKFICRLYINLYLKRVRRGDFGSLNEFKRFVWCLKQLQEK